jgi:hypothetical protein
MIRNLSSKPNIVKVNFVQYSFFTSLGTAIEATKCIAIGLVRW